MIFLTINNLEKMFAWHFFFSSVLWKHWMFLLKQLTTSVCLCGWLVTSYRCLWHQDTSSCKSWRCKTSTANSKVAYVVMERGTPATANVQRTSAIHSSEFALRNTSHGSTQLGRVVLAADLHPLSVGILFLCGTAPGMTNPGLFYPSVSPGRWVVVGWSMFCCLWC